MTNIESPLMLGTELRLPFQHLVRRIHESLVANGIEDIRPAHFTVFQVITENGARSTELADLAQMTKQSMGALIDHLESHGYMERVDDPRDGRARIVRLTDDGWKVVMIARGCIAEIEREWEQALGARRYEAFRAALQHLNARMGSQ